MHLSDLLDDMWHHIWSILFMLSPPEQTNIYYPSRHRKEAGSVRSYKRQHNNVSHSIPLTRTHPTAGPTLDGDHILLLMRPLCLSLLIMMIRFSCCFQLLTRFPKVTMEINLHFDKHETPVVCRWQWFLCRDELAQQVAASGFWGASKYC